jgi:hypothetical protein
VPSETKTFVTNYPNTDFTFQHLQEKIMIVSAVTVHSAFSTQQGGYPLGSGLIFTANYTSYFDMAASIFEDMTHEQYLEWRERKQ